MPTAVIALLVIGVIFGVVGLIVDHQFITPIINMDKDYRHHEPRRLSLYERLRPKAVVIIGVTMLLLIIARHTDLQ